MAIPQNILAVERPKNTFVIAYGKNKNRYAVRKYVGCRYKDGRRLPIKGPTIGHIINFKFVSNEEHAQSIQHIGSTIEIKDWANILLCDSLFRPVLDELLKEYNYKDALKFYVIAILRVCHPGIKDYELNEFYKTSFLSELYPDVALSKNTVSEFFCNAGKEYSRIVHFMRTRAENIELDAKLLVDGTLKSNESKINTLSDFSRKAKMKGTRDISVLYAFDLERMEPVCSKCYPGNMLDCNAYEDFVEENHIHKGLVVADKGFPSQATQRHREKHPNIHYLNPIKRNSKFIKTHQLYDYEGTLIGHEGVTFKKVKVSGKNKWLYSFRDASLAAKEEKAYLATAKKENTFNNNNFKEKQKGFGTIVLESDLDLPIGSAYKAYLERWEIEIVMRYYKNACEFDETRVHNDYSVIGSEFCDFLSTILTFRLIKKFDKAEILEKMNYSRVMTLLQRAKKARVGEMDWNLICVSPKVYEILCSLGLIENKKEIPMRGRGRPRKSLW